MQIFSSLSVERLHDLSQHQVESEEGAEHHEEYEEDNGESRLEGVHVVIHHEDPAFKGDGHEDAEHGSAIVVKVNYVEEGQFIFVKIICFHRESKLDRSSTLIHFIRISVEVSLAVFISAA
jgi:hypothetical protein